jgi:inner membrane protein
MYQVGHYGSSLLVYAPLGATVAVVGDETIAIVGGLVCVALSTLPDVDHRLPAVTHRGPTHTALFALLVGTALAGATVLSVDGATAGADVGLVAFAFVVGALSIGSHLLADALTPIGIRPFWPVSSRRYSWNLTRAKNPAANAALLALGLAATAGAVAFVAAVG